MYTSSSVQTFSSKKWPQKQRQNITYPLHSKEDLLQEQMKALYENFRRKRFESKSEHSLSTRQRAVFFQARGSDDFEKRINLSIPIKPRAFIMHFIFKPIFSHKR